MKLICFILCFCSFVFKVGAQKNWEKGIVVTISGDTLHGEILFEDWEKSPINFVFRQVGATISKKFTPDSVKSFSLADSSIGFVSKPIRIKYYLKTPVETGASPVAKEFVGNAFLEILLRGESVILYSYLDEEKEERYFIEKENLFTELLNIEYTVISNGTPYKRSNPFYKVQLKKILNECPTLKTSGVNYNAKDLLKLVKDYLSYCGFNYKIEAEQKNTHDLFNYGLTVGSNPNVYPFHIGFTMQILSKKKFHNRFIILELGRVSIASEYNNGTTGGEVYGGIYGGTYFGLGTWKPFVFSGFSSINGFLDTGGGIAFRQKISLGISSALISSSIFNSPENYSIKLRCFF